MAKKRKNDEDTKELIYIEGNEINNQIVNMQKNEEEIFEETKNTENTKEEVENAETMNEKTEEENSNFAVEKKYNNYEINSANKSKKGVIVFSIIVILVLILALFSTIFSLANLNNVRIIDGVTVKGISLSRTYKRRGKDKIKRRVY